MDNENANNPDEKKSLKEDFDESATPDDLDDSKVKFLNGGKQALEGPHVVVEVFIRTFYFSVRSFSAGSRFWTT